MTTRSPGFALSSFSSILYADCLKRAALSTGILFLVKLVLVRRSPGACRSFHRASFSRSARSCTQIAWSVPVFHSGFLFSFSSILYADRLKRAGLFAGLPFSSCALFQCRLTRLTLIPSFLRSVPAKNTSPVLHRRGCSCTVCYTLPGLITC